MRTLALVAVAAVVVSSCSCGKTGKLGGLIADVHRGSATKATCVELAVTATESGETLDTGVFPFGMKTELQIAIGSDGWPRDVTLKATPMWSASGCDGAVANGPVVEKPAMFPAKGVETVQLDLAGAPASLDGDGDGYVKMTAGGPDCDDANGSAFPGAPEDCTSLADLDCDRLAGCADPQCSAVMGCARPADRLVFVTPARSVPAGVCSAVLEVQSQTAAGQAALPAGTSLSLAAMPAGARFFSDSSCTQEVTSLTAAAGQSRFTFHFSSMTPGGFSATAASAGLMTATQAETVTPPPAMRLAIVSPARTVQAGTCSAVLDVESQAMGGAPVAVTQATQVDLAVAPGGAVTFFSDATCTTAATSVTLAAMGTRASFYVRGVTAGVPTVTASAAGLMPGSQAVTVTAGAAAKLEFTTAAQGVARDACSTAVTVRAADAFGNPVAMAAAAQVDLTVAMGVPVTFHSAAGCGGAAISQVSLAAAAGSVATFYFRGGMTVGSATVRAGIAGDPLTPATQDETVGAGPPHHLAFITPPRPITAGGCSGLVTVQSQDDGGIGTNPMTPIPVTLAGAPAMGFGVFSDPTCTTALAGPLMIMGTPAASFYFSATQTPSVTVSATTTTVDIAAATPQQHPVGGAGPSRLVISTPPQTLAAGACSQPSRVDVLDQYGNLTSGAGLTLAFNTTAQSFTFHGPNDCASLPPQTTDGGTGADFRFRGTRAGPADITVSAGVLTPATQTELIDAGPASTLVFTTQPRTQTAGVCTATGTPLAVQTQDGFGNPVVTTGTDITLTNDAGFRFFAAAGCAMGTEVAQVQVAGTAAPFWFEGRVAGPYSINAASGVFTPAAQQQTILADVPARLAIVRPTPNAQVNVCSAQPVTVQTRDQFGNPVTVPAGLTISVDGGTVVSAYDVMACGMAVPSIQVTPGGGQATFFFRSTAEGQQPVAVSAAGFTGDTQSLEITPGPKQVGITGVPATYYAGQCVQLTVRTEDSMGNPLASGADTTVTLSPAKGFTFFSDAACSTQTATVTVTGGQTSATVWFRAVSGGTFNIGASAPTLSPASVSVTVISAVRTGVCTIANSQTTSAGCTISPPLLAMDRTFLVFQSETVTNADDSNDVVARCRLTSASNIECRRNGAPGGRSIRAYWQTATLPTAVQVQHVSDGGQIGTSGTMSFNDVGSLSDVFVLHSISAVNGTVDDNEHDTVELQSTTSVALQHEGAPNNVHDLQIIKYPGATVARGTTQLDVGMLTRDVAVPSATARMGREFLLYSWRTTVLGNEACERNVRGYLDGGAVSFAHGGGTASCTGAAVPIAFERVQLPAGASVQAVDITIAGGATRGSTLLGAGVDPTRTLVFTGSNTWSGQGLGENNITNDPNVDNFVGRFALDGGSEVLGARADNGGTARFHVFVVELDPR